MAAIEGATDQMWFQAAVDRRAETAAVSAIASGSQHSTMSAISQRMARSLSVSAPMSSATYRMVAASTSALPASSGQGGAFRFEGGQKSVGGHLDPGGKGRLLRREPGHRHAALARMGGHKLGIDAGRIDDGKAGDTRAQPA
jgi:hypothetical protein